MMFWRRLCAFVVMVCFSTMLWAGEPLTLRVLTYNVHHGEGIDGKLDLERIAGVIKSVEPDLVALQEIDKNTTRTGNVDQAAELARLTGKQMIFGGNIRYQGGDYGNAVFTNLPIKTHKNHALPLIGAGEQRGVLEVELELPTKGESLTLLATHLDARPGDQERVESAKVINQWIAKSPQRLFLLAGDINDVPDSPTLRTLAEHWTTTTESVLPTVPSVKPRRQIDYVMFSPKGRWKVVEVRVLAESVASDHRALLAVLELAADSQ